MPLILIVLVEWHCPYGEIEINKSDAAAQELLYVCTNSPAAFKTSDYVLKFFCCQFNIFSVFIFSYNFYFHYTPHKSF